MYYEYQYEFSALLVLSLAVVCLFYKPSIYKKYGRSVSNAIFLCYIFSLTDAFTAMLFNTHNPKYYSLSYLLMSIYFLSAIWLPYFLGKFIFEICEAKFNNIFYAIPNIVLSVILLGFNNFTHLFFDIDKSNLEYVSGVFFLAIDLMFVLLYIGVGLNAKSNYVFLGKVRVRTLIGLMVFDITVILYQFINRYIL
ncbi:MAG: hypothetical protein K6B41_00995, partial [Butyrivibrio sp.]|nr:hypothetical protein [Butyrivibrio sp.]